METVKASVVRQAVYFLLQDSYQSSRLNDQRLLKIKDCLELDAGNFQYNKKDGIFIKLRMPKSILEIYFMKVHTSL